MTSAANRVSKAAQAFNNALLDESTFYEGRLTGAKQMDGSPRKEKFLEKTCPALTPASFFRSLMPAGFSKSVSPEQPFRIKETKHV